VVGGEKLGGDKRVASGLARMDGWVARREKKRERAMGGMLIGKKKIGGKEEEGDKLGDKGEEGRIKSEIVMEKEKWIIISVYNRKAWKDME